MLKDIDDKSRPNDGHLWILDTQPDGTFKMESGGVNRMMLQCERNRVSLGTSKSDSYPFWRREGNFIVSDRSHSYLGVDQHDHILLSTHCDHTDDDKLRVQCQCAIEKIVS